MVARNNETQSINIEINKIGKRDQKAMVDKLRAEMEKQNLDAMILTTVDTIYYATGYRSFLLHHTRKSGFTIGVITKEGKLSLVLSEWESQAASEMVNEYGVNVVTYPTWIHVEDFTRPGEVPAQPDLRKTYKLAAEQITGTNSNSKIGIQHDSISVDDYNYLSDIFGKNNLIDATNVFNEVRMYKTPWEIDVLRTVTSYAEIAMQKTLHNVIPGMTYSDVSYLFRKYSIEQSKDITDVLQAHTFGADFAPVVTSPNKALKRGDLIRLDGGPNLLGYNSDIARTFAVGGVTDKKREEIYDHLWSGYQFGINNIGPGVKISEIYKGIHQTLGNRGFNNYLRGHQGHSLGCSTFAEEAPFIGPNEHRVFEPGMVFSFELPYYGSKSHTYNIEDTLLITETGIELFSNANPSLYKV